MNIIGKTLDLIEQAMGPKQFEQEISKQDDRLLEHLVKLLAFESNDYSNKWLASVAGCFDPVHKEMTSSLSKRRAKSADNVYKWIWLHGHVNETTIENVIDGIIYQAENRDLKQNSRTYAEILSLTNLIVKALVERVFDADDFQISKAGVRDVLERHGVAVQRKP